MIARNRIFMMVILCLAAVGAKAQTTTAEMGRLTVNHQVTTVLTAGEPIRFVDISTDQVVGDQPMANTIRLKPKDGDHRDGDVLAVLTVVTERSRVQYALLYTGRMSEAVTDKVIEHWEVQPYNNPEVAMSRDEMCRFARRVWASPARYRTVSCRQHRMTMRLNNIYAVGDYFFIDYSVENRSNIRFDIDELRVKLADKRVHKATNAQVIELQPELVLHRTPSFLHGMRNVVVLHKLTFPNDKVLTIELSERQISGRTIALNIDYDDVLNADSFSRDLLVED